MIQVTDREDRIIPIATNSNLETAIEELKLKRDMQEAQMIHYLKNIKEDVSPINLAKAAAAKITGSSDALGMALKIGGTLGAALVTKKIINTSRKDVRKHNRSHTASMLTNLGKTLATNYAVSHVDEIKAFAIAGFRNLFVNKDTKII